MVSTQFRLRLAGHLGLLSSLLILASLPVTAQSPPSLDGRWIGSIDVPGMRLGIELTIDGDERTFTIPTQGVENFPIEDFSVESTTVTFTLGGGIPGSPAFELEVEEDGERMSGTFTQSGSTLPAEFERDSDAAERRSLAERSPEIQAYIDSMRTTFDVPGLSVGIVYGKEETTFVSGVRSIESGVPVSPATQFAIGSTTKAFTATLLGSLVDEGLLTWNDRVVDHLPDFRLHDPIATEQMRVRDLLTHVSGLPRHDLLWYLGDLSRQEILHRLRYLEPVGEIRDGWRYNNLMYMVAGMVVEQVTGNSYEEELRSRVLEPLDMLDESTLDVVALAATTDAAAAHRESEDETMEVIDYRPIVAAAPAGSINASSNALLKWIRFNLEGPGVDDRPVSTETLRTIQGPEVVMSRRSATPGMDYSLYGFGWMISTYRDDLVVYHGGTIDGFDAVVFLAPEERIAISVLSNRNSSLPHLAAFDILDMLQDRTSFDHALTAAARMESGEEGEDDVEDSGSEVEKVEGTRPSGPIADFVGTYVHPAYDTIVVSEQNGSLIAAYVGEEGKLEHHHYDVFTIIEEESILDGSLLEFDRDLSGRIRSVGTIAEPTLPAIEFLRIAEARLSDPDYLARFVGSYDFDGTTIVVSLRRDRLRIVAGGQAPLELDPVGLDQEGDATFRLAEMETVTIRFEGGNPADRIVLNQPGGTFTAERIAE